MHKEMKDEVSRRKFLAGSAAGVSAAFLSGITPDGVQAYERSGTDCSWFENAYRLWHIDAHFGGFKSIYRDFDAEKTALAFSDSGAQMLSFFSKCWAGYSYYPTEIGTVHPGLDRDFTGELSRALKKHGIRRVIYFMMGMERRYQHEHPDWIRNAETPDPSKGVDDVPDVIPDAAMMCFNSPYVDQVALPQMKEIIERYDPDGFFIDIIIQQFLHSNCRCKYCRELYRRDIGGEIPVDENDPRAFEYRKWANSRMEGFIDKVHRYCASIKPDIEIINNYTWMMRYPVTPPSHVHHITWDTPVPTVGLFAVNFSLEARYVSTLPNITWSCMNTRGNTWGEYSLRAEEAFLQECATLLAACGRTYLSDIPYPHGNPDPAVMKVFGNVNKRTKELEPHIRGYSPIRDAAVLHSADSVWSKAPLVPTPSWIPGPAYHSVCGAHKALAELHVQFGILNSEVLADTLDTYGLLILPSQRVLSEDECDAIRRFVKNGGVLIVTGETGVRGQDNRPLDDFALADVLGIRLREITDTSNSYLRLEQSSRSHGLPDMDIHIAGNYVRIETTTAETIADIVPPYEGIKGGTPPPALEAEGPGITVNRYGGGTAVYCASPLCQSYYRESTPVQRTILGWLIDKTYPEAKRAVTLTDAPANVEVFLNVRGNERMLHLVNYSGDKRETGVPQTQSFTTVHGIGVSVDCGRNVSEVVSVPDGKNIAFTMKGGFCQFESEPLEIHNVYRLK